MVLRIFLRRACHEDLLVNARAIHMKASHVSSPLTLYSITDYDTGVHRGLPERAEYYTQPDGRTAMNAKWIDHQSCVAGPPLKGPTMLEVIPPP